MTISSFTKESCRYRLVALVGIDSDGDGLMDKLFIKLDQMFSADSDWFLYVCDDFNTTLVCSTHVNCRKEQ